MGIIGALSLRQNFRAAQVMAQRRVISSDLNLPHNSFENARAVERAFTGLKGTAVYFPIVTLRKLIDNPSGKLLFTAASGLYVNHWVGGLPEEPYLNLTDKMGIILGITTSALTGLAFLGPKAIVQGLELKENNSLLDLFCRNSTSILVKNRPNVSEANITSEQTTILIDNVGARNQTNNSGVADTLRLFESIIKKRLLSLSQDERNSVADKLTNAASSGDDELPQAAKNLREIATELKDPQ